MGNQFLECVLRIISGLAVAIPLVIELIKYVKKSIKEKNWNRLLALVIDLMKEAEQKFEDGASKKEWVIAMVKASADSINYDIDVEEISQMIDNLCDMTKIVNPPAQDNIESTPEQSDK